MRNLTTRAYLYRILLICIALVWVLNGLYCKLLNQVPRHQLIVARILGSGHAHLFTLGIGLLEVCMAGWILSGYRSKCCAIFQAVLIAIMNAIEFYIVPDLLLYGHFNSVVALFFITVILLNEYVIRPPKALSK